MPGAVNVPLPDIAGGYPVGLPEDHDTPILTVCKVGERSLHGMILLKAMGYHDVKNVKGGLKAWQAAGLPTPAWELVTARTDPVSLASRLKLPLMVKPRNRGISYSMR